MFIRRAVIRNVRSIEKLEWTPLYKPQAGWHVILGDNGSGKSSFLRSLSLALVGPNEAIAARQDWSTWVRSGADWGWVQVDIMRDPKYDCFSGKGSTTDVVSAKVEISRSENPRRMKTANTPAERHVWGTGGGWFSAAYGPFRRFTGGDKEAERSFLSSPKLGAHISVFGENVSLSESLEWLRELNYKRLEQEHSPEGRLLTHLRHFVNQDGFLPHHIKLKEVSSNGVEFEDANGFPVAVEELSDGYRSILSMTFELIRQLSRAYPGKNIFDDESRQVIVPGVVMIDEIDAHLHPTWQKKIGFWLTEHFPNLQFIVTTHSPLICQAAVRGSIYRLPTPGMDESGHMLGGTDRDRLLYGDILDAYSTEAFGPSALRSTEAHEMQQRLAALNIKELDRELSAKEKAEQERLRAAFPTSPHTVSSR